MQHHQLVEARAGIGAGAGAPLGVLVRGWGIAPGEPDPLGTGIEGKAAEEELEALFAGG